MELAELQKHWNEFGRIDPLWAILTSSEKINGKWEVTEFFNTGVEEIEASLDQVRAHGMAFGRGRALDFGCGVGRLTQALCPHFDRCVGIDIAPSMIKRAQEYNRYGGRCEYQVNETGSLAWLATASFDFIYSNLVLQHMEPVYSKRYIEELVRLLAPGGALVFQLPDQLRTVSPESGGTAMPDAAFSASIKPALAQIRAAVGSVIDVPVTVTNQSSFTWPGFKEAPERPIALGNHWLTSEGEFVLRDDARAVLERELRPMEQIELVLKVTAPDRPGTYILQLDMVQEFVAWFAKKGSLTAQIDVTVAGTRQPASPDPMSTISGERPAAMLTYPSPQPSGPAPKMEMYGVSRAVVTEIIRNAGGTLVDVQPDDNAGPAWLSFRYFVTKGRTPSPPAGPV